MFSRADNASKVALAWLVGLMRRAGYVLLDCQFMTDHLRSMGAVEVPQQRYRRMVEAAHGRARMSLREAWREVVGDDAAYAGSVAGAGGGAAAGGSGAAVGAGAGVRAGAEAEGEGRASSPGKRIAQSLTQTA